MIGLWDMRMLVDIGIHAEARSHGPAVIHCAEHARVLILRSSLTSLVALNGKNHAGTGIPQLSQSPQL